MYRASVVSDGDHWLTNLQQVYELIPAAVEQYAKREIRPYVSQRVDQTLRVEPPRWAGGKRKWESEKQRRAYFATDGFGHGIPYKRTGQYVKGWHVRGDYTHGLSSITVYHDWEKAQYVGGNRQQQMHKLTGWSFAPDVLQVLALDVEDRVKAGLPSVVRQAFEDFK